MRHPGRDPEAELGQDSCPAQPFDVVWLEPLERAELEDVDPYGDAASVHRMGDFVVPQQTFQHPRPILALERIGAIDDDGLVLRHGHQPPLSYGRELLVESEGHPAKGKCNGSEWSRDEAPRLRLGLAAPGKPDRVSYRLGNRLLHDIAADEMLV